MITNIFLILLLVTITGLSIGLLFKRKELALIGWITLMVTGIMVASTGLTTTTGTISYDATTITPETAEVPLSKPLIAPSMILGGLAGILFTISSMIREKDGKTYGKKAFEGY